MTGIAGKPNGTVIITANSVGLLPGTLNISFIHSPQIYATAPIYPSGWNYVFDSANNLYSSTLEGGGLLKTSPIGKTSVFFSGLSTLLIGKDNQDNIYVITDSAGDFLMSEFLPNGRYGLPGSSSSVAIQKISPDGSTSIFCNSAECSSLEVVQGVANGGGVADSKGNLYVPLLIWSGTDPQWAWGEVAQITPSGNFSIFAGASPTSQGSICQNGSSTTAVLEILENMIIDPSDTIYFRDGGNAARGSVPYGSGCSSNIRRITPAGVVSSMFASTVGSGQSLAIDSAGNFYYYVYSNTGSIIKKLSPSGIESSFCGGATWPTTSTGNCSDAYLQQVVGNLVFDALGNLYFMQNISDDSSNYSAYKIIP